MPYPSSPLKANSYKLQASGGFTLIELMIVVGIISLLAAITIIGVNPARQISNTRNAQRVSAVATIQASANHYAIDTFGGYPTGIDGTLRMLGTSASGCSVNCGPDTLPPPPPAGITSFADDTQAEFDAGAHSNTQWNTGTTAVGLDATGLVNRTGTYLSKIFDAATSVTWNSFSWLLKAPYGKELPSPFTVTESGYPTGNASMASNVLLMHMNETSGTINDVSGNANNGTLFGTMTYASAGAFGNAFAFNGGANNYIRINNAANLNLPNTGGTVMLWIKPVITTASIPQNSGMGILRKPDYAGNLYAPGGYGLEIFRNLTSSPANIKMSLGWNNGGQSSQQTLVGATNILNNTWYHIAMTWNAGTMNIYVNGVLDGTAARTAGPLNWANGTEKLYIGHNAASVSTGFAWYDGTMDEMAFYGRILSPTEISDAYARGAYHPKIRVRSCDDSACSGETFVGPGNNPATYYSEEGNTTLVPSAAVVPPTPSNRYFQYQVILDTDTQTSGPEIKNVSGANNGTGGGGLPSTPTTETTADSCLDLTSNLVPTYITEMPVDPQVGTVAKTYYAIKKLGTDNVIVRACSPELGKSIEVTQ